MRLNGDTFVIKPVVLPNGQNFSIRSRDLTRDIPCRPFFPSGNTKHQGLLVFCHGGGWCFMTEQTSDTFLQYYADSSGCVAVSVAYRLAPKHPFPAGAADCVDAVRYFYAQSPKLYGGPLRWVAGESAGAHFALLTILTVLELDPTFNLAEGGLLLHFGIYSLVELPSRLTMRDPPALTAEMMCHYAEVFTPGMGIAQRMKSTVSPLYWDLEQYRIQRAESNLRNPSDRATSATRLPSAFFCCGTADPLVDDTIFMAARWQAAGGEAVVKFCEGAHHGVNGMDVEKSEAARQWTQDVSMFLKRTS